MDIYDSRIQRRLKPTDGSIDLLADKVNELKSLFSEEYKSNPELYDKCDLDRLMDEQDDWYARRWIIYLREVEPALNLLKDTMKWRKEMGLNELSYEDFPREFFEIACTFEYGRDKMGRRIVWTRGRIFKPVTELRELYAKYYAFLIDQCDKRSLSRGFMIVLDATDAGISNVDMYNLNFMISLRDKFPLSARQIIVTGLPWMLTPVFKVIMSVVPPAQAAVMKVINLDELTQYVEENQIPTAIGPGTSKIKFQLIPEKSQSIEKFDNLSKSTISKFKSYVQSKTDPKDFEVVPSLRVIR